MKYLHAFTLLFVALVVASNCAPTDEDEDEVHKEWETYKAKHSKKYTHAAEHEKRKKNFHKTHKKIKNHNKESAKHGYTITHNKFSDMEDHEKRKHLGVVVPPKARDLHGLPVFDDVDRDLPLSFDSRNGSNCVGPVQDQQDCGCCWAFSAVAALEYSYCVKNGNKYVKLSEQASVDCDTFNAGCNGGWPADAWEYWKGKGGVVTETAYGIFIALEGTCRFSSSKKVSATITYGLITPNNPAAMQTALIKYGVLSVAIRVVDKFYQYHTGVYTDSECDTGDVNHATNVVGWGTLNGKNYWIMRNSWTASWGTGGYMYIQRGVNKCKIESYPYYVQVA